MAGLQGTQERALFVPRFVWGLTGFLSSPRDAFVREVRPPLSLFFYKSLL